MRVDHCPTCGQGLVECGSPWPPSLADLAPLPCRLPVGHPPAQDHLHPPLWPGAPVITWPVVTAAEAVTT